MLGSISLTAQSGFSNRIRIETRSRVSFWNPDRRVIRDRARLLCVDYSSVAEVWGFSSNVSGARHKGRGAFTAKSIRQEARAHTGLGYLGNGDGLLDKDSVAV